MIDKSCKSTYIDLRNTPCPLNFVRCSLAAEKLQFSESLNVCLDKGEPEETVISGLRESGYIVDIINQDINYLTISIKRCAN